MRAHRYLFLLLAAAFVLSCNNKPADEPQDDGEIKPLVSPEGSVENDIVYAYLQCGPYEKFGAKTWFKDPVVRATADVYNWKNDRPKGITVSWDKKADVTVSMSTGGKVVWEDSAIDADSYTFSGMIPGKRQLHTHRPGAHGCHPRKLELEGHWWLARP